MTGEPRRASHSAAIAAAWFIFHVPVRGSVVLLLTLSMLYAIASLSLGVLIASRTSSQRTAMYAAMLGTMAAGLHDSADAAMHAMTRIDHIVTPDPRTRAFHDAKFAVYRRMVDDQLTYRAMMTEDQG